MNEPVLYVNTGLTTLVGLFLVRLLKEHDKHGNKIDALVEDVTRLETIVGLRKNYRGGDNEVP